jgi:hypothetical protein
MPGSGLYAVSALVFLHEGKFEEALRETEIGIESARQVNLLDPLVELLRLRGETFERLVRMQEADACWTEAQGLAGRIGSPALQIQIFAVRVRYLSTPPIDELNPILASISDTDFASVRSHLNGLFFRCGVDSDALLLKGLRVFQLFNAGALYDHPQ